MTQQESLASLKYLGLPEDYSPSPSTQPVEFLKLHLAVLPLQVLEPFSTVLTPRQRTAIPLIRNRRTRYALEGESKELGWEEGRLLEPLLWDNMTSSYSSRSAPSAPRPGIDAGQDEREWAEKSFIGYKGAASTSQSNSGPQKGYVGRLGELLAEYEEEREAEHLRSVRRERIAAAMAEQENAEEFDSDSSDDEDELPNPSGLEEHESIEEVRRSFERILRERFIDGLLPVCHLLDCSLFVSLDLLYLLFSGRSI